MRGAESARVWKRTSYCLSLSMLHYSSLSYASPNDSLTHWQHAYLCERECVGLNSLGIKKERKSKPTIQMTYHRQYCWQPAFVTACVSVGDGVIKWQKTEKKRAKEVPGLTWKKGDDALLGVLLPSLDWELVEKLHLEKKGRDKHTSTQESKLDKLPVQP